MTRFLAVLSLVLVPLVASAQPMIGGCPVFPADNPWNQDISTLPVHPMSSVWIGKINGMNGGNAQRLNLHPDWGSLPEWGIPFVVVPDTQPVVNIVFDLYPDESDPGPYPFPPDAPIEGTNASDGDRHVIVIQQGACKLYEVWRGFKDASGTGWHVANGAVFDLTSNTYRPDGWTSADAAGLPIFPGLVRYDEVAAGHIDHALRFTVPQTQEGWIHPARHMASSTTDTTYPPMGARLRLRADYDVSGLSEQAKVIAAALKKYGMILSDNGSAWFISGATDARWNDDSVGTLKTIPADAFDVVYTGPVKHTPEVNVAESVAPATTALSVAPSIVRSRATVSVTLAHAAEMRLSLVDLLGREVACVAGGMRDAGDFREELDATALSPGLYLVRLQNGAEVHAAAMIVTR